MSKKSEEYRAKAQECERQAGQFQCQPAKLEMLETAHEWRRMAEQAEQAGR
jgi:hypothetical protein